MITHSPAEMNPTRSEIKGCTCYYEIRHNSTKYRHPYGNNKDKHRLKQHNVTPYSLRIKKHAHTACRSSGGWQQSVGCVCVCSPECLTSVTHLCEKREGGRV